MISAVGLIVRATHLVPCFFDRFGLLRLFGQAFDLERVGRLEEAGKVLLRYVDLAVVDVLDQGVEIVEASILENDDGVLARVMLEGRM